MRSQWNDNALPRDCIRRLLLSGGNGGWNERVEATIWHREDREWLLALTTIDCAISIYTTTARIGAEVENNECYAYCASSMGRGAAKKTL